MRLVPRQLQRSGMTGSVPKDGGRLTPAQAYAAFPPHVQRRDDSWPAADAGGGAPGGHRATAAALAVPDA